MFPLSLVHFREKEEEEEMEGNKVGCDEEGEEMTSHGMLEEDVCLMQCVFLPFLLPQTYFAADTKTRFLCYITGICLCTL